MSLSNHIFDLCKLNLKACLTPLPFSPNNSSCFFTSSYTNNKSFRYELLKWDEILQHRRGNTFKRDLEWPTVAREIALMNKPYSRQ